MNGNGARGSTGAGKKAMSVRRRLFLAMAAMIAGMALVFSFISHVVQADLLDIMVEAPRKERVAELAAFFEDAYVRGGGSWNALGAAGSFGSAGDAGLLRGESVALMTPDHERRWFAGTGRPDDTIGLGIRADLFANGSKTGTFYFLDEQVRELSRLRLSLLHSTRALLIFSVLIFSVVALLAAFWMAGRFTRPLQELLTAIDRLGAGDLDARAPVARRDEYGRVAEAFNVMAESLRRTEDARRRLVADVAHELRTPLTIVRGRLDAAQQRGEPLGPEQLLPLQDELIRLTRLVEELHQLSLAEAKRLPLERRTTEVYELLARVIRHVAPDAEARNIRLTLKRLTDHATLSIDPNRMTQVFLNLIVNAVRYTPEGGSVTAYVDETAGGGAVPRRLLRVTIADTGPGIAPEQLPFIFNRFYRTDDARSRVEGGMGLGLSIVKEFVEAHGGAIDVASEPGRGTVFAVTLPCEGSSV